MAPPTVAVKCPSCGAELRAVLAPAPPTQWFPCPSCHVPVPVVVPSDLPPLYSWEVIPSLYPQLSPPRRPRWRLRQVTPIALAVAAVLAAVSGGLLSYYGFQAAQPSAYLVSGTVYKDLGNGVLVPVSGAHVRLLADGNRSFGNMTTGANGTFWFAGVPNGGIELNVTATSYAPTVVYTFASRSYSTGTQGLEVTLEPGGVNNTSSDVLSPFANLEAMLSDVGGTAVLCAVVTIAAGIAAWMFRRPGGAVGGVIGGGAAVVLPAVLLSLSLGNVFSLVTAIVGVVGGAGAFATVLATVELASRRTEPVSA